MSNYSQREPPDVAAVVLGIAALLKDCFSTSVSITHGSWRLNNSGIHPGLSHLPPEKRYFIWQIHSGGNVCARSFQFKTFERTEVGTDEVVLCDSENKAEWDRGLNPLSQTLLSLSYLNSWMRSSKDRHAGWIWKRNIWWPSGWVISVLWPSTFSFGFILVAILDLVLDEVKEKSYIKVNF